MISDELLEQMAINAKFYATAENVKEMAQELLEARKIISVDTGRLVSAAKKADILYVGCDTPDALADEVLSLRRKIGALEAELEYNEEGYKKMRHNLELFTENAVELAAALRNARLMFVHITVESDKKYIKQIDDALDNHKQVMKEVE